MLILIYGNNLNNITSTEQREVGILIKRNGHRHIHFWDCWNLEFSLSLCNNKSQQLLFIEIRPKIWYQHSLNLVTNLSCFISFIKKVKNARVCEQSGEIQEEIE